MGLPSPQLLGGPGAQLWPPAVESICTVYITLPTAPGQVPLHSPHLTDEETEALSSDTASQKAINERQDINPRALTPSWVFTHAALSCLIVKVNVFACLLNTLGSSFSNLLTHEPEQPGLYLPRHCCQLLPLPSLLPLF